MPWSWLEKPIEHEVQRKTGRAFDIDGKLDVDFFPLTIKADHVVFGNAAWSKEPTMFEARDLVVQVRFWPLVKDELDLPMIAADQATLLLEAESDERRNWRFGADDGDKSDRPRIGDLRVRDGKLRWRDARKKTDVRIDLRSEGPLDANDAPEKSAASGRARFVASGEGTYRGSPFKLEGKADSPADLADSDRPYRVETRLTAGATKLVARGQLAAPMQLAGFDLDVELSGANLHHLYPLLGIAMPDTPPYRVKGRLRHAGDVFRYTGLEGVVGESDVAGDALVDLAGDRSKFVGELRSKRVRYVDVAGFLGGEPGKTPIEAAKADGTGRVLPHKPYDLGMLRSMDAEVKYRADRLELQPIPFESMVSTMTLKDGVLTLDPLEVGMAGGTARMTVRLDARQDPIAGRLDATLRSLELPKLFRRAELAKGSIGRVGGKIALEGRGNSVADMLGASTGDVSFAMGRGRVSNLLLEFAGIDIAEIIKFKLGEDKLIPIHCAYADFGVKSGTMTARAFVFDTSDTAIVGEGTIDLRDERFDLRLIPKPKDKSPLSLRSPLRVTGRFVDPEFGPEKGPLALKALAAAALYAIAPPAALVSLMDAGEGDEGGCEPKR